MSEAALQVRGLSYGINGVAILRNISFSVAAGSYVSIVGPNGAGKTTLLKCLNRILNGTADEVQIEGKALADYAQAELAKVMGYVPQGGTDQVPFLAYEFVMMGRYPHLSPFTSPTATDHAAVLQALETAGAADLAGRQCATLSGGERQKILVAAALAQEAGIFLLDEPTTFLDPHHQDDVLRLLTRLNKDCGATIVSVTHDINAAVLSSDDVIALRDGQVVFQGPPEALTSGTVLADLFDQEFHFVEHPVNGKRLIVPLAVR